nr:carboxypeptidase regulatory-like domain-containing protein [Bryobacter sp.]
MSRWLWKLWLPALAVLAWELASRAGALDPLFFASPSIIGSTMVRLFREGVLGLHLAVTLQRIAAGFLCGTFFGLVCTVLAALWPAFARSIEPTLAALYSVPKLTLLPLFILSLGAGDLPRIVIVSLGVFLLVSIQTLDAVRSVSPDMIEMARNYGARGWSLFQHVYWPSGLPRLLTALRVGVGRATVLTISTEILGSRDGIGSLIWFGWQTFATERIFVGVVISALLGAGLLAIFRRIEKSVILWLPLLLLLAPAHSAAQTFGLIEGRVLDPSGAGVSGVSLRIRESSSGVLRSAVSGSDGSYRTPALPPGDYELELAPAGFQPLVRTGIRLEAGRAAWVDLPLSLGATREAITVTAQPALVNTNASDW